MRLRCADRNCGQALLWTTLAVPLFVCIAGLAIDGGVLLDSHRQLQSIADGAARAAATRVDMSRLRASAGVDIQLDAVLASEAAHTYIDRAVAEAVQTWSGAPDAQVEIGPRRAHIWIRAKLQTAFLRIVHIDEVPVEASAFADVEYGIHDGAGGQDLWPAGVRPFVSNPAHQRGG
jgi:hypothetical protein